MTTNAMTCEVFNDRLLAYLEREDDDATRSAVERHAASCAECGSLLAELQQLRVEAGKLPELEPSRDLWSGIAARIEAPVVSIGVHQAARPFEAEGRARIWKWVRGAAIAASLVAAAGIGYAARGGTPAPTSEIAVVRNDAPTALPIESAPEAAPQPSSESREPRAENAAPAAPVAPAAPTRSIEAQLAARAVASLAADYDREIARLQALVDQRRNQLDPATVAVIEKNLMVIDTAIAESKKAIARDPASGFLIESLDQSLRRKVELMRTAALLPSRT